MSNGIGVTYIGTDGSRWNLRDVDGGDVFLTDGGLRLLGMGEYEYYTRGLAAGDGDSPTGHRAKPRKVFLPVLIGRGLPADEWFEMQARWWDAHEPGLPAAIEVVGRGGAIRTLEVYFVDDGDPSHEQDPALEGAELAGITYQAHQPFWVGEYDPVSFSNVATDVDFFGGPTNTGTRNLWAGEAHDSRSLQYVAGGLSRTNEIRNPVLALAATSWTPGSAFALSVEGGRLRAVATTAVGAGAVIATGATDPAGSVAGATRTARMLLSNGSSSSKLLWFRLRTSASAIEGAQTDFYSSAAAATVAAGATLDATLPAVQFAADVSSYSIQAVTASPTAAGDVYFIDDVLAEPVDMPGETPREVFSGATPSSAGATPFYIAPDYSIETAVVDNPGKLPIWLTYVLRGPLDNWALQLGGGLITGPIELFEGDVLTITTEPRVQTAILVRAGGASQNVTPDLTSADWRPVQPGMSLPLAMSASGLGSIDVLAPPLYRKPI